MDNRKIQETLERSLGGLLGKASFQDVPQGLKIGKVPLMAMNAIERIVVPLHVFVARDGETELDIIINDSSGKAMI